jgi:hypothetical protein
VRIHVGDSELVRPLLEYFEEQADCIALQVGETEIEVSLLGSFRNEVHDATVERLVDAFRLYQRSEQRRHSSRNGNGTR